MAPVFGGRAISYSEFYNSMTLKNVVVWYPNSTPELGANVWYSTGNILGGHRIVAALGQDRCLHTIGMG